MHPGFCALRTPPATGDPKRLTRASSGADFAHRHGEPQVPWNLCPPPMPPQMALNTFTADRCSGRKWTPPSPPFLRLSYFPGLLMQSGCGTLLELAAFSGTLLCPVLLSCDLPESLASTRSPHPGVCSQGISVSPARMPHSISLQRHFQT